MLGRTFIAEEDKPHRPAASSFSVSAVSKALQLRSSILNQTITLDGVSYTIIGVMPSAFEFPIQNEPVELWTTIAGDASGKTRSQANAARTSCASSAV